MQINQAGAHYDHMLKQTRAHHIHLSTMADIKANIMLTISSVVMTMSIKYINDPVAKWAAVCLIISCITTISLAVYTVMPKISIWTKPAEKPDPENPCFNILFFADFVKLPYEEYEKLMVEILNDPTKTYQVQLREIYGLGCFLASKKFRYVQLAYATFIAGIIISGLVLAISFTVSIFS